MNVPDQNLDGESAGGRIAVGQDTNPPIETGHAVADEQMQDSPEAGGDPPSQPAIDDYPIYDDVSMLSMPRPRWQVDHILREQSLVMLYAPRWSYKSTLAVSLMGSIATGMPWCGHAINQSAPCFYLALEDQAGIMSRLSAWKAVHGIAPDYRIPTYVNEWPADLGNVNDANRLVVWMQELGAQTLFLDTFTRALAGRDENSSADMGIVMRHCGHIQRAAQATVVIVHHSGLDGKRERGSSAIGAAVDTVLSLRAPRRGEAYLSCEKQRNGAPFKKINLTVTTVPQPTDEEQDASACVIDLAGAAAPLTDAQQRLLAALRQVGPEGLTATQCRELAGKMPKSTYCLARKELLARGDIRLVKGARVAVTE